MSYPIVKGASYILVHAPDMVLNNGTTQTTEKSLHPDSEYLKNLPSHLRTYEEVVNYLPNQVYIGNYHPDELRKYEQPWHDKKVDGATREGRFGEIMPQDEFIGMIKIVDSFDLVKLTEEFTKDIKTKLINHPLITDEMIGSLKTGDELSDIERLINEHGAEGLFFGGNWWDV